MAFRLTEARASRSTTQVPPTETRIYHAVGNNDSDFIQAYAVAATPYIIGHRRGTLFRQDLRVTPRGFETWEVEVPYSGARKESGNYALSFDTTGGTLHITNSLQTVNRYTAAGAVEAAPDMGGAIGVRGDQIDGVDITIPALKIVATFTHPRGIVTLPTIKNLARWTGKTNSTPFLTFAAGEVLFLGATGNEGSDVETSVAYSFAMSQNITGQTLGNVTGIAKKGWEHAWIWYEDAVVGAAPVKRPRWVYVERVYEQINMAAALGFG